MLSLAADGTGGTEIIAQSGFVWTGTGDGSNWNDAANWSSNAVPGTGPTTGANVVITLAGAGVTIAPGTPALSVASLTIGGSNLASIGVGDEQSLTVTGAMSILAYGNYFEFGTGTVGTDATSPTTPTLVLADHSELAVTGSLTVHGQLEAGSAQILVDGGSLTIDTASDTTATWTLSGGGTIAFSGLVAGFGDSFNFAADPLLPGTTTLAFNDQDHSFGGSIAGFDSFDVIDLQLVSYSTNNLIAENPDGTWTISYYGATEFTFANLSLAAGVTGSLMMASDGLGGTDILLKPHSTWTGADDGSSWNDAGNWAPNAGVPGLGLADGSDAVVNLAGARVLIAAGTPALSLGNLTITGSDTDFAVVEDDQVLSVTGVLMVAASGYYAENGIGVVGSAFTSPTTPALILADNANLEVSGSLTVYGQMQAGFAQILVDGGTFIADTETAGLSRWRLASGGTIAFHGPVSAGSGDIFSFFDPFSQQSNTLSLGEQGNGFNGTITDFGASDVIDLTNVVYSDFLSIRGTSGGAWNIDYGIETTFTFGNIGLDLPYARQLTLQSDGHGGTEIVAIPAYVWTGAGNVPNWNDANNWTPTGVPGVGLNGGADAVIDTPGALVTINAGDPAVSLEHLTLTGSGASRAEVSDLGGLTVTDRLSLDYANLGLGDRGVIGTTNTAPDITTLSIAHASVLVVSGSLTVHGHMALDASVIAVDAGAFHADTASDTAANWILSAQATVTFSGLIAGGGDTFTFLTNHDPAGATLAFGAQGGAFAGAITGLDKADEIDLTQLAYDASDQISGTSGGGWTILRSNGTTAFTFSDITLADPVAGNLALVQDGHGSTGIKMVLPAPLITISQATDALEGTPPGAGGTLSFTLARSGDLTGVTTVGFRIDPSSFGFAASADDLVGGFGTGSVTFAAGQSSAVVTFETIPNSVPEPDKKVTFSLTDIAGGGYGGTIQATANILNDDGPVPLPPVISITQALDAAEGTPPGPGGTLSFTLTRTGDLSGEATVTYSYDASPFGNTATADDLAGGFGTGSVTFLAGQATAVVLVQIAPDTTIEPDEKVQLSLTGMIGAAFGSVIQATASILDDDTPVVSVTRAASAYEDLGSKLGLWVPTGVIGPFGMEMTWDPNTRAGNTLFYELTRTGNLSISTTVNYYIGGGTAQYNDIQGGFRGESVTFAPGETSKIVAVQIQADTTPEPDETVVLTLTDAVGGRTGSASTGTATILDDDTRSVVLVVGGDTTNEGTPPGPGGTGTFRLTRTGDLATEATATYSISSGTATADDVQGGFHTGSVTFAVGQRDATVSVGWVADTNREPNETVLLTLTGVTGGSLGPIVQGQATIADDDTPPPSVITILGVVNDGNVTEGTAPDAGGDLKPPLIFHLIRCRTKEAQSWRLVYE